MANVPTKSCVWWFPEEDEKKKTQRDKQQIGLKLINEECKGKGEEIGGGEERGLMEG